MWGREASSWRCFLDEVKFVWGLKKKPCTWKTVAVKGKAGESMVMGGRTVIACSENVEFS